MIALQQAMTDLLACGKDALHAANRDVGRVLLNPGADVVWDDCCKGQLWVRVGNVPATQQGRGGCGVVLVKPTLFMGVVRCAHVLDDQGNPPTADEVTGDAIEMLTDMDLLLGAIDCCFRDEKYGLTVVAWNPLGVLGGCAGGEWQMNIALPVPCGCPE